MNNNCSSLKEVIAGIPQGSTDGLLLFNLFINDILILIYFSTLSNYADNNNLFTPETNIQLINKMLSSDFHGKCHFMSIAKDTHDKDAFYYDNLILKK